MRGSALEARPRQLFNSDARCQETATIVSPQGVASIVLQVFVAPMQTDAYERLRDGQNIFMHGFYDHFVGINWLTDNKNCWQKANVWRILNLYFMRLITALG